MGIAKKNLKIFAVIKIGSSRFRNNFEYICLELQKYMFDVRSLTSKTQSKNVGDLLPNLIHELLQSRMPEISSEVTKLAIFYVMTMLKNGPKCLVCALAPF